MSFKNRRKPFVCIIVAAFCLLLGALLIYQVPAVKQRLEWRIELAQNYVRGVIHPAGAMPTPADRATLAPSPTRLPTATPPTELPTPTTQPSPTYAPSPTPIPGVVTLPPPAWELQGMNDCGPASLSMYLRFYGWEGNQDDITAVIKPVPQDRNVNPEELVYFVRNYAGWLNAEFRVGGDLVLLRQLLAAGIPVIIEESFTLEDTPGYPPLPPSDDRWAAHYLLLTGYDDSAQSFTGQDSYHGANQSIAYDQLDRDWQIFNRVYLLVYLPSQQANLQAILGSNWDANTNRQHALEVAQIETQTDPNNAFAWFNLGSNLVYFERYGEAASAYDTARTLGLPQRMLRYQFGPFFAYFHAGLTNELLALTEYALERTDNSEEALLWHGWALYRQGDTDGAIQDWQAALEANPTYLDAQYALDFAGVTP
jgi:tetratricopeptide (TPR) repeat protein